ncbi:MAG: transposase, partial [Rhodobacteraceae bacterium]|nr:transposase [Paracoccaceae bacterium]
MDTSNINDFDSRDGISDGLADLLRTGAQQLIAKAGEAELESFLAQYGGIRTECSHAEIVRIPKVRSKTGTPVTFRSALVPPYIRKTKSLEAALPWLYLKGVSSGKMGAALKVLLGPDAKGFSANTVSRLKREWAREYEGWREQPLDKEPWIYIWADG